MLSTLPFTKARTALPSYVLARQCHTEGWSAVAPHALDSQYGCPGLGPPSRLMWATSPSLALQAPVWSLKIAYCRHDSLSSDAADETAATHLVLAFRSGTELDPCDHADVGTGPRDRR